MKVARRGFMAALAAVSALKGLLPPRASAAPVVHPIPLWPEIGPVDGKLAALLTRDAQSRGAYRCGGTFYLATMRAGEVFFASYMVGLASNLGIPLDQVLEDRRQAAEDDLRKYVSEFVFYGCGGPWHSFSCDSADPNVDGFCWRCGAHKPMNMVFTPAMAEMSSRALLREGWQQPNPLIAGDKVFVPYQLRRKA